MTVGTFFIRYECENYDCDENLGCLRQQRRVLWAGLCPSKIPSYIQQPILDSSANPNYRKEDPPGD